MTTAAASPPPADIFVVEPARRLSASSLWSLQRRWYERFGVDAWRTSTVPHHATNNAFLARAYAEVIAGFLRDCAAAGADPAEPVHIVELGAGCGRFGFLLLRALDALLASARLRVPAPRYVLTDFAASNLRFLRDHAALRPFVERGMLDFALFDAQADAEIRLLGAGTTIGPGALQNPIVVLANYVFDSLPQHGACRAGSRFLFLCPQGVCRAGSRFLFLCPPFPLLMPQARRPVRHPSAGPRRRWEGTNRRRAEG